jgi:uncharacterized protein YebE (UPF0316 family)
MNTITWSAIIFGTILIQVLLGTVRHIFMIKNNRALTIAIGFFEAAVAITVAIIVISNAVKEGINVIMILSYSAGFALGLYLGMLLSQLLSRDILSINIFSKTNSYEIEDTLREKGFGVTSYSGNGKDGDIWTLHVVCKKSNFTKLKLLIKKIDPKVMVTSHTLEGTTGGFIYGIKSRI